MKKSKFFLGVLTVLLLSSSFVASQIPIYNLWGVTAENVNNYSNQTLIDSLVSSLKALHMRPTTRIVFAPDDEYVPNPGAYNEIVPTVHAVSDVMGEILDSYYWDWGNGEFAFDKTKLITRLNGFKNDTAIYNNTTIWEVGNEVNGSWVYEGNTELVQETIDTLLKIMKDPSVDRPVKTAITLYFYPNTSCVENQQEPEKYMMVDWATALVKNYPDVVNNLDYVFISYYRDANEDCTDGLDEGWYWTGDIGNLMSLFPNSIVGFGEVGWSTDNAPSTQTEVNIVNTYYSYYPPFAWPYIPWTRACFYWNYQYDCLENVSNYNFRSSPVWHALDSLMYLYGYNGDKLITKNKTITADTKNKNNYSLSDNYPNPFNPVTSIRYNIPKNEFVSIKIYDVSGREVKSLVNEYKSAGSYIVSFNAADFASGIYFYRMQSGNFAQVKKMILVK